MVISTARVSRLAAKASQIINRKRITAINEISEPIDEMVFHRV